VIVRAACGVIARSDVGSFHCGRKELACAHHARGETLLMNVAADGFEGGPVPLETIGPEIVAEYAPSLLDMIDEPRQSDPQRVGPRING